MDFSFSEVLSYIDSIPSYNLHEQQSPCLFGDASMNLEAVRIRPVVQSSLQPLQFVMSYFYSPFKAINFFLQLVISFYVFQSLSPLAPSLSDDIRYHINEGFIIYEALATRLQWDIIRWDRDEEMLAKNSPSAKLKWQAWKSPLLLMINTSQIGDTQEWQ